MFAGKNKKLVSMAIWSSFLGGIVFVVHFLFFSDFPGGMRSGYNAQDYDVRLTVEAKTATPLIASLERFHSEHHTYPSSLVEIAPYLPFVIPERIVGADK